MSHVSNRQLRRSVPQTSRRVGSMMNIQAMSVYSSYVLLLNRWVRFVPTHPDAHVLTQKRRKLCVSAARDAAPLPPLQDGRARPLLRRTVTTTVCFL